MKKSLEDTYAEIDRYFDKENIKALAILSKELAKDCDALMTAIQMFSTKPEVSVERLAIRALDFAQNVLDKLTDGEVKLSENP
jgi:hypothetical protein